MFLNLKPRDQFIWIVVFIALSIAGFMIRLPSAFSRFDKELHALFYFGAAAFLNILFSCKKLQYHLLIFAGLLLFGILIESAQEFSRRFYVGHGYFDWEDIKYNFRGLYLFSFCWILYSFFRLPNKIDKKD